MRRPSLRPAATLKVAAAFFALAFAVTGCSSGDDPLPTTSIRIGAGVTSDPSQPTDTGQTTEAAPSGKLVGENLLTWSDYSALGIDGLTTRYAAKPGQVTMARCEKADMRDAKGLESLWQGTAEPKKGGRLMASQQIASFGDTAGADGAVEVFKQWNDGCPDAATAHEELDLSGGAKGQSWLYDGSDGTSELVLVVRLPERVSYGVVRGPRDAIAALDVQAIAAKTAARLA